VKLCKSCSIDETRTRYSIYFGAFELRKSELTAVRSKMYSAQSHVTLKFKKQLQLINPHQPKSQKERRYHNFDIQLKAVKLYGMPLKDINTRNPKYLQIRAEHDKPLNARNDLKNKLKEKGIKLNEVEEIEEWRTLVQQHTDGTLDFDSLVAILSRDVKKHRKQEVEDALKSNEFDKNLIESDMCQAYIEKGETSINTIIGSMKRSSSEKRKRRKIERFS